MGTQKKTALLWKRIFYHGDGPNGENKMTGRSRIFSWVFLTQAILAWLSSALYLFLWNTNEGAQWAVLGMLATFHYVRFVRDESK